MIESRNLQEVQHGTGAAGFGIHAPDNYFVNSCLHNSSGTHLAWFQRHIHGAALQAPVPQFLAGLFNCGQLGMGKGIFVSIPAVVATRNNFVFIYDDTADGHFINLFSLFCLADSFFQSLDMLFDMILLCSCGKMETVMHPLRTFVGRC